MNPVAYPPTLPAPQTLELRPFERRALSGIAQGAEQRRGRSRDFHATLPLTWVFTRDQLALFFAWGDGASVGTLMKWTRWFSVTLPGRGGFQTRACRFFARPKWEFLQSDAANGLYRVTAEVEQRGLGVAPQADDLEVNISATINAGISPSVGITVAGLDPAGIYALSLPSGRTYVAYSEHPGTGWLHFFNVTTTAGTTEKGIHTAYADPETARAAFPGAIITGFDTYTFWIYDTPVSDNSGGLSIHIARVW